MTELVERLTTNSMLSKLYHEHKDGRPLPSGKALCDIIELFRATMFPGYFGEQDATRHSILVVSRRPPEILTLAVNAYLAVDCYIGYLEIRIRGGLPYKDTGEDQHTD